MTQTTICAVNTRDYALMWSLPPIRMRALSTSFINYQRDVWWRSRAWLSAQDCPTKIFLDTYCEEVYKLHL